MRLRTFTSALALTAALFATSALTLPAAAQDATTISGGFDVGPGGLQGNFNPLAATSGFTWLSTYFEPLVIYNAELTEVVGALAESFEISDDQLTYTFKLADAKWHDGEPFTAEDVKFTIDLAKNDKTGSVFAARLGAIASVEAPDEHTVVITLSAPTASMTDTLTKLMMLPEHALAAIPAEELAKNAWWSTTPIGTGPFKFVQYATDQYVELAANPDYRGGAPKVERLINRFFADPAAAIAALRAGEIQFTYVDSTDVSTFADDDAFRVIEGASYVVNYFGFNQQVPLWQDLRVRQAFMHAIDRNAIIASLYGGAAVPANCVYTAEALVPAGHRGLRLRPGEGQGAARGGRLGRDQRRQADRGHHLLRLAPGRERARRRRRRCSPRSASTSCRAPSTRRPTTASSSRRTTTSSRWSSPACRTAPTPATSTSA